ncbi:UDP-N-acetylmuramoylalanine--D-glutamate ligase [Boudabousia tangfeifanii]|uniref:UDP-N-acetylmuramoylalanine--D-glutamate ligase n=1 Tax=Boudabousia tangfeifanii TaxID=1912795 RepID=A0A1D9MKK9_9ACTO|nr:UDP-N-acetylmuramoyl-L-alanine--D-glutamate ligase [Boudabousia tangfeifanii]AOZ72847.1 UDP-N-acetylmuramoylalanine--D-glutamate ligase [Boudabousia tangfeifanii]
MSNSFQNLPTDLPDTNIFAQAKRAAVLGAATTGLAVAEVLTSQGIEVTLYDGSQSAVDKAQAAGFNAIGGEVNELGEQIVAEEYDLVVASPGIPPSSQLLAPALAAGRVWSEVELAWHWQQAQGGKQPWLCVTGTNGKTTTVGMCGAILTAAGYRAPQVGNIGRSILTEVATGEYDALVVELSSFQLFYAQDMAPTASVCLNVAADHLDWHGSTEAYAKAKAKIYENTITACVYPESDAAVIKMVEDADVAEGARAISFTLGSPAPSGIGVIEDNLIDRAYLPQRQTQALFMASFADLAHLGPSALSPALVSDALAAIALTRALDVEPEAVSAGLRSFELAGHRRRDLGVVAEVNWIDDSKATNAHAAAASLAGIAPGRAVWIAGGLAKGQDFHDLVKSVAPRLRSVVVIGEDRSAWLEAFAEHAPQIPLVEVDGHEDFMMSVVHECVAHSLPGDTVVLAPACASWDQFNSYAQRGEAFAQAVARLAEQQAEAQTMPLAPSSEDTNGAGS